MIFSFTTLKIDHFDIYESGWPYATRWRDIIMPRRASTAIRGLIGKTAIGLANAANIAGLKMGDRFIAVLRPRPQEHSPSNNSR